MADAARDSDEEIVFDWNRVAPAPAPRQPFDLNDETLRDGLQSPSVREPSIEQKVELVTLMSELGVQAVNIGIPGAGARALEETVLLARHIADARLSIEPNCAARTVLADIHAAADAQARAGVKLWVYAFIGSSPIRQWAEGWDLDFVERTSAEAIRSAVREGLDVAFVTEDTTRSKPEALTRLFTSAVEHGAKRLVLCDTVGHATPEGTQSLVRFALGVRERLGRPDVKLEWHGHNDRGLAVVNALRAIEAGVDRVHGCGLGVGERVGNTSLDLLLLNLRLLGWFPSPLESLVRYVHKVSEATGVAVPVNYPLAGEDAFRTATGVHAAAIIKAKRRGDEWLADRVYSGVPAREFGLEQVIEIGPMSGMSNVRYWLERRHIAASDAVCQAILERAKSCRWTLSEAEVLAIVASARGR